MNFFKWTLLCLCYICFNSADSIASYKWGKTPEYFVPIPVQVNNSIPASEIEEGCFLMMIDLQVNFSKNQNYYHYAYKLTSENGVQNNSEIQISYNPAYQKLVINSIRVFRNRQFIDYSTKAKIKELQREEGLEYHIYDETITTYIILEDIHIGDIIEYSYIREGSNPIFENFKYQSYAYQLSYTLLDFNLNIIKPKELKLFIKNHETDFKPTHKITSFGEELTWRKSNIPGLKTEEYMPSWFDAYPFIEISSSDNWGDVRNWGIRVFKNDEPLSSTIKDICNKINNEQPTEAKKAMAALRFIQKEIRYLGIEIGVSSHKPTSPNKVFNQRYGDCKDKALLLSKMLNELGIQAYPAFVSTTYKSHVQDYLPSPMLFNHAVVKAILNDNKPYWFDPTSSNQGGDIDHYYFPSYANALVLNGDKNSLDTLETKALSYINITERFTVKDFIGNATLNVVTTYYGCNADEIRYSIATSSKKNLQDGYLNFYKNYYWQIDSIGSIAIRDDSVYNEVTIFENYLIKDFWKSEDTVKKNILKSEVTAFDINNKISVYTKKYSKRKYPLYIEYPLHLSHEIEIALPVEWNVEKNEKYVDNDFFTFKYHSSYENKVIKLKYDLASKQDFVEADKSSKFIEDIQQVNNIMSYQLLYNKSLVGSESKTSWSVIGLFLIFIISLSFICYTIYKKYDISPSNDNQFKEPEPIGGWVILPIIGLIITPIFSISRLITNNYFSVSLWDMISNSQSSFSHPLYSTTIVFEIFIQCSLIVLPIALLVIAFKYDKRFPKFMIFMYSFTVIVNIIDIILASSIPNSFYSPNFGEIGRSILVAFIWIPYFMVSKRCKTTFIK